MFLRLLFESFARQRRRKTLAGLAILLGVTAVTAMLALATTIGDRIHAELAVYGANIVVYPKADTLDVKVGDQSLKPATGNAYLHESDLAKLRGIFWANNITGVSPELDFDVVQVQTDEVGSTDSHPIPAKTLPAVGLWFDHPLRSGGNGPETGALQLHPLWKISGQWPRPVSATKICAGLCPGGMVIGRNLANKYGITTNSYLKLKSSTSNSTSPSIVFAVVGIASTDSDLDNKLIFTLSDAQTIAAQPDAVSRVEISARTRPEDAFARRDPDTLTGKQHDLWYCRPYANSIAYQIKEAIPGAEAEQVRQVEQSEGTILERISGLMWLISAAALLAAAVAVSAAMATAVLERRAEIGLMRSLGASKGRIASLFYAEAGLLAIGGGTCGYIAGSLLAAILTAKIFGEPTGTTLHTALTHAFNPVLLPVVLGLALLVAIAGSTASIRGALRMDPSAVLRANA
jgi:putative ABC transport system permease protein